MSGEIQSLPSVTRKSNGVDYSPCDGTLDMPPRQEIRSHEMIALGCSVICRNVAATVRQLSKIPGDKCSLDMSEACAAWCNPHGFPLHRRSFRTRSVCDVERTNTPVVAVHLLALSKLACVVSGLFYFRFDVPHPIAHNFLRFRTRSPKQEIQQGPVSCMVIVDIRRVRGPDNAQAVVI